MKTGGLGIDSTRIEAMIAQLKAAATNPNSRVGKLEGEEPAGKVNFADALKSQLDQVSAAQNGAVEMGKAFTAGDDKVSLSDVMIATQKAGIAFQATVQVRNKLVTAYQEIMNMQV